MVAAAVLAVASPAHAGSPPVVGYVWGHDPANPDYVVNTGYEYNSTGGPVRIIRNVPGSYHVVFRGMAGSGGVAHASAYGSNSVCTVNSYGPRGIDQWVHVLCFDNDGDPIDSRFVASFTNLEPAAGPFGYLWNDNPVPPAAGHVPPADRSFDSAGQPIVVHRTGVGAYEVELGAFAQDSPGPWADGFLTVTAYGAAARHCQLLDPALVADPERLYVRCYDDTGFGVDTRFTLTYARGITPLGTAAPGASATVDQSFGPVVDGWTNPAGGQPAAVELGVGSYLVSFPAAGAPRGHAIASIMATPPAYCNIHAWWQAGGTEHVWVKCYDGGVGVLAPAMLYNVGFLA